MDPSSIALRQLVDELDAEIRAAGCPFETKNVATWEKWRSVARSDEEVKLMLVVVDALRARIAMVRANLLTGQRLPWVPDHARSRPYVSTGDGGVVPVRSYAIDRRIGAPRHSAWDVVKLTTLWAERLAPGSRQLWRDSFLAFFEAYATSAHKQFYAIDTSDPDGSESVRPPDVGDFVEGCWYDGCHNAGKNPTQELLDRDVHRDVTCCAIVRVVTKATHQTLGKPEAEPMMCVQHLLSIHLRDAAPTMVDLDVFGQSDLAFLATAWQPDFGALHRAQRPGRTLLHNTVTSVADVHHLSKRVATPRDLVRAYEGGVTINYDKMFGSAAERSELVELYKEDRAEALAVLARRRVGTPAGIDPLPVPAVAPPRAAIGDLSHVLVESWGGSEADSDPSWGWELRPFALDDANAIYVAEDSMAEANHLHVYRGQLDLALDRFDSAVAVATAQFGARMPRVLPWYMLYPSDMAETKPVFVEDALFVHLFDEDVAPDWEDFETELTARGSHDLLREIVATIEQGPRPGRLVRRQA